MSVRDYWQVYGCMNTGYALRAATLLALSEDCSPLPLAMLLEATAFATPDAFPTVVVRVRPFNQREMDIDPPGTMTLRSCRLPNGDVHVNHQWLIDADGNGRPIYGEVLWESTTQEAVYDRVGARAVDTVVGGTDACIFAYGQTGTGKTHTIFGGGGLCPRIIGALPYGGPQIRMSFLEIYREIIIDLMTDRPTDKLRLLEVLDGTNKKRVRVEGLISVVLTSAVEALAHVEAARLKSCIHVGAMQSRSHTIVQFYVNDTILTLVDMAGSERNLPPKSIQALHEYPSGSYPGLSSISSLGEVLTSLAQQKVYIPYRASKMTHFLRECLGGHCVTAVVATVSPSVLEYVETKRTLMTVEHWRNIRMFK